jgi:hypothetical protein
MFIYCEKVKTTGIVTLAALFNAVLRYQPAESFPITTVSKRYGVVTSETADGVIENLIREFNKEENADGKNLQVIIGSAVIGEGRSLLSVRDIFIMTPFWNFTDMDQAIGRGIRFNSHRYLKAGEKTVAIHRLRGYYKDQSIDDHMIRTAYQKDILSKEIESAARTAAIDCRFNYRRNRRYEEQSRQCLYQDCEYKCAAIEKEEELVDTYNLFYTEKEYQDIKKQVQKKFAESFEYELDELLSVPEINKYSIIVVLRSLTSIIQRNEPFINPLGFISYLKASNGVFFLVHDYSVSSDKSYLYDTKLGQKRPSESFKHYVDKYPIRHLQKLLQDEKFDLLPEHIKIELLKDVLYETRFLKKEAPLYQMIENKMKDRFLEDEQISVGDEELVDGKWVAKEVNIAPMLKRITSLGLNYYGLNTEVGLKRVTFPIEKKSKDGALVINIKREDLDKIFNELAEKRGSEDNAANYRNKPDLVPKIEEFMSELGILVNKTMHDKIVKNALAKQESI